MLGYEGDPAYAVGSSGVRYARACAMLEAAQPGSIDGAWMRRALSDHGTEPAVCRHAADAAGSRTAFWSVADVTTGDIAYGAGTPCRPGEERYRFD
jgi:hypothetical protein